MDVVEAARQFAADVVAPNAEHWDRLGRVPYDAFERAAAAGLCSLTVPQAAGGRGETLGTAAAVMEILAGACMNTAFSFAVHNNLAAYVAAHGSDAQRVTYLPRLIAGRQVGAFLLTEPNAGSDVQAITTSARRDGDGWVLTGEKAWVSNGAFADLLSVYVQTEPGSGARGIAAFLVPASTPGVVRGDGYELMRGHALGTASIRFEDCRVDAAALVLEPGRALAAALEGIDSARIYVAAMCCGLLGTSLREAVAYADQRQAFGQSTLAFQGLQWELADVATDLEAMTLLTRAAITRYERGESTTVAAAHAKKFATRAAFNGVAACMQAMGARGFLADTPLGRHLAAAKMAQFLDGTTGIQNIVIGRDLKRRYAPA